MEYRKSEAKEYAKQHCLRGVWSSILIPLTPDYQIDYEGHRHNLRYWRDVLELDGLFVNGHQGESIYHMIAERKKIFDIAVEEGYANKGKMFIMCYTSDPMLEYVVDMTKHAEQIGADWAIIANPRFYTGEQTEEGCFQYYKYIADRVNIGIVIFNNPFYGQLMSPRLVARLAELPNIVGIKDAAPAAHRQAIQRLCGDKIVVAASETDWLENFIVNGVEAMIPGPTQYLLQSKKIRLIKDYVTLAKKGEIAKAWEAFARLEPMRKAYDSLENPGKTRSILKYWSQLLGMVGGDGRVRIPHLELTAAEKERVKAVLESTELVEKPVKVKV